MGKAINNIDEYCIAVCTGEGCKDCKIRKAHALLQRKLKVVRREIIKRK